MLSLCDSHCVFLNLGALQSTESNSTNRREEARGWKIGQGSGKDSKDKMAYPHKLPYYAYIVMSEMTWLYVETIGPLQESIY